MWRDAQRALEEARHALRPKPLRCSRPEHVADRPIETVRVIKEELDRLKACAAIVEAAGH